METRELILQTFNGEPGREKDTMLRACEESVMEYALKDMKELLGIFKEIDVTKLDEESTNRFNLLYSRIFAIVTIGSCEYDNIHVQNSRGLEYRRISGAVVDIVPNGKKACQVSMWSGMDKFTIDPKEMTTEC
jgi:hypothetical protein